MWPNTRHTGNQDHDQAMQALNQDCYIAHGNRQDSHLSRDLFNVLSINLMELRININVTWPRLLTIMYIEGLGRAARTRSTIVEEPKGYLGVVLSSPCLYITYSTILVLDPRSRSQA